MPRGAFVTLVPRPSYGVLRKVLQIPNAEGLELWHLAPAGGRRYVTIATGRNRGQASTWFRLVTFEKTPDGWTVRQRFLVDHPAFSTRPGKGRVGAQVRVGDYDADGKPEAKVVYRFPTGPRGDGEIRKVAMVSLDGPAPRLAARFVVADRLPGWTTAQSGYFKLRDLNADGHPDILLSTVLRRRYPAAKGAEPREAAHKADTRLLWDPRIDRWELRRDKDALPATMRIGLEGIGIEPGNSIGLMMSAPPDTGCLDLSCLDIWGLPALSRDGKVAVLLRVFPVFPRWLPAPGFATANSGLAVDVIRLSDGKRLHSVDLIDGGIQGGAYQEAQDPRCTSCAGVGPDEPCDPRLCPRDEARVPVAINEARASIRKRIHKAARGIPQGQFAPLLPLDVLPPPGQKAPPPSGPFQGLRVATRKVSETRWEVRLLTHPGGKVLATATFPVTMAVTGPEAWIAPRRRLVIMVLHEREMPDKSRTHYAVVRIPAALALSPQASTQAPAKAPPPRPARAAPASPHRRGASRASRGQLTPRR